MSVYIYIYMGAKYMVHVYIYICCVGSLFWRGRLGVQADGRSTSGRQSSSYARVLRKATVIF
jgi:hypothetical protein